MKLNRRGFTFLELVAVMAILSVILLITIPEFIPYKLYSEESKLRQEILDVEYQSKKVILQSNLNMWKVVNEVPDVKLWTSKGLSSDLEMGEFLEVPPEVISTNLEGGFYLMRGRIYYSMTKLSAIKQEPEPPKEPEIPDPINIDKSLLLNSITIARNLNEKDYESGFVALKSALLNAETTYSDKLATQGKIDRIKVILDKAISQLVKKPLIKWVQVNENDFDWKLEILFGYRANREWFRGYYQYTGNEEYIIIPDVIKGTRMTDYRRMFEGNRTVKGVSNTTSSITEAYRMFHESQLKELNLSNFNVSGFKDFTQMFYKARIDSVLNIESWNTSAAIYMNGMFAESTIQEIKIGNINTNNLVSSEDMFRYSTTNTLDLSSFNLVKSGLNMNNMVSNINVNKLYVKNQQHKNKIVSSGGANANKVFIK